MTDQAIERVIRLPLWQGPVNPVPLEGGITNLNFVVSDGGEKFFVRTGVDVPVHGIMRFNELAASKAAAAVGLSPEVIHHEPGVMVTRFVEGRTFGAEDVRDPANFDRVLELIRRCHTEMPRYFRGAALIFWVFHVIRDYAGSLRDGASRSLSRLPDLLHKAGILEAAVGPIQVVFAHNDLLAANFIDSGERLWLIDWDYAGFNSPLFDLANVASNNEFSPDQEEALLAAYFGCPVDAGLLRRYRAMAAASLLREAMWSMVQEIHSTLDFDYAAYSEENLARFERVYGEFQSLEGGS
jgi:thiamine kinase-like enzyme